ncbi:MAG: alpha amylase C-terminal domain-containing protein [Gemmatimonadota bacterium]
MIVAMVDFRRVVAGTAVGHWWDDGGNAIAFSRGDKGFVAINHDTTALDTLLVTGMPAGSYCDLLTGGVVGGACAGATVVVDSAGAARLQLAANAALAIDAGSRM